MEAAPLSEGKTGNLIVQLRAIVQLYYRFFLLPLYSWVSNH